MGAVCGRGDAAGRRMPVRVIRRKGSGALEGYEGELGRAGL